MSELAKYTCDKCKREFDIFDVGYIGPYDRDDQECSGFYLGGWVNLCNKCEPHKTEEK